MLIDLGLRLEARAELPAGNLDQHVEQETEKLLGMYSEARIIARE